MANGSDPIDKYHNWTKARLRDWYDHVDRSHQVFDKVTSAPADYSWRQMAGDFLGLWMGCFDTAYGWMYPSNGASGSAQTSAKGEGDKKK